MRHEFLCAALVAAMCGMIGACASSGGGKIIKMNGDKDRSVDHVSESAADKLKDAAHVRVELGQQYMHLGKLELALENLKKALQYDDKYVDAHTVIAVLYERIGNLPEAEKHYARAVDLAPKSGDTNNNYGQFLCAEGKYVEAQKYFSQAMQDPFYKTPDVVYTNAGTCLMDHGGSAVLDDAEKDFRRALEANPQNVMALFHMAKVLYLKNDFFHARAFIQRFEAQSKPDPSALLLARNIEVKLGHADTARDYAQRLRQDFPDSDQTRSLDAVVPAAH